MAIVNELLTGLGFKIDQASLSAINAVEKGLSGIVKMADTIGKSFTIAKGVMDFFTGRVVKESQGLLNLSKTTGLSTDALQKWTYTANAAGVSAKSIISDIKNLKSIKGFSESGIIDWMDRLSKMDTTSALRSIADLGLSEDFLALVKGRGASGVLQLLKEADRFKLSEKEVRLSDQYAENMNKFFSKLDSMKKKALVSLSPEFNKQLEDLTKWLEENDYFIKEITTLGKGLAKGFEDFFSIVKSLGKYVKDTLQPYFKEFGVEIDGVKVSANLVTGALLLMTGTKVINSLKAFGAALHISFAPILKVAAAVTALIEEYQILKRIAEGDSEGFVEDANQEMADVMSGRKSRWNWINPAFWVRQAGAGMAQAIGDIGNLNNRWENAVIPSGPTTNTFSQNLYFYGNTDPATVGNAAESGLRRGVLNTTGFNPFEQ